MQPWWAEYTFLILFETNLKDPLKANSYSVTVNMIDQQLT